VRIFDFARDRRFDFAVKLSMYAVSPGILPFSVMHCMIT